MIAEWIDLKKIKTISFLSSNPNSLYFLVKHPELINWIEMSKNTNPNAMQLIEKYEICEMDYFNPPVPTLWGSHPNDKGVWEFWFHIYKNFDFGNSSISMKLERMMKNSDMKIEQMLGICLNPNMTNLILENMDILLKYKPHIIHLSRNPKADLIFKTLPSPSTRQKYQDWIVWMELSANAGAIELIDTNTDKINWDTICNNTHPKAIQIIKDKIKYCEEDKDILNWRNLSANAGAMELLEGNPERIDWGFLSKNSHPRAISLLEKNILNPEINWSYLSANSGAIELLRSHPEKIDWEKIAFNPSIFQDKNV